MAFGVRRSVWHDQRRDEEKDSHIYVRGQKTDNEYGGEIAICRFLDRSTEPTGAQVLRSISALDNDSWRAGFLSGMAGCGDHGTHRSVPLCLASSTFLRRVGRST